MAVHFGIAGVRELITSVRLGVIEFPSPMACQLNRLFMRIAAANENGDTLFDVKVNGVSIYGSPALRPKILTDETTSESFPSVDLTEGDMVTVDVVGAPLGGISGLYVLVQLQDAPTVTQYIKDAYNGALNRDPSGGELSTAEADLGSACAAETTLAETKDFFDGIFLSAEYVALATTNAEYLEDLYQAVLGRPSDPGGFTFWLAELTGGLTRQLLRDSFNNSVEHVNQRVLGWCPTTLPLNNAIQLQGVHVSAVAPGDGDSLVYDSGADEWGPSPGTGGNATQIQGIDVDPTAPTSGQTLVFDGADWVPTTPTAGGAGRPPGAPGSYYFVDDFLTGKLNIDGSVGLGWNFANAPTEQPGPVNHPGIMRHGTTASSGNLGAIGLWRNNTTIGQITPTDTFDMLFIVRLNMNDANTKMRAGIGINPAVDPPTDGMYIEKELADTDWFGVTRAAGAQTRTAALAAISTDWVKFRIRRVDASTIGFTVDGGTEVTATLTITTASIIPFVQIKNSVAVAKNYDIDYFDLAITGMAR